MTRYLAAAGFTDIQVQGVQRYPLSNHLYWLRHGKPGGQKHWASLRDAQAEEAYARLLDRNDLSDTLVATAEGWRRIDSLVGKTARVIGADGQAHWVEKIFPTGRKPVFRLRTKAGFELRITADHKVWTSNRGDVAVKDLAVGDQVGLLGAGFGRRALNPRLAMAIGVAVGDGCLARGTHGERVQESVIFSMAAAEAGVLDKIADELNDQKRALRPAGMVGRPDLSSHGLPSTRLQSCRPFRTVEVIWASNWVVRCSATRFAMTTRSSSR